MAETPATRSALTPLVMKVFCPFSTHPPALGVAVVRIPWRSLPAPGSLIAIALTSCPEQKPGSQRRLCSSVARAVRYGATTSVWSGNPTPLAPARVSSSLRTVL